MDQSKDRTNSLENQRIAVAERRRSEGDLVGALTMLRNLEDDGCKNTEVIAQIGAVYFDMELYEQSLEYWFKYLASSDTAKVKMRAYSAISACFCMIGDFRSMAFYAELEFALDPKTPQEYDRVLTDYYDYVYDVMGGGYYVSYPETKIPARRLMYEADGFMDEKKYDEAADKFSLVQKSSEYYGEARFKMAKCLYLEEKYDEYGKVLTELIADCPEDAFANMAYGFYMLDAGQYDEGAYYLKKASEGELFDEEDYFRIARDLCEIGRENDAFLPLERALEINCYYLQALYYYGLLTFNTGDYETAARYFKTVYQLSDVPVAKLYYEYAEKKIPTVLEYSFDPSDEVMNAKLADIIYVAENGKKAVPSLGESELSDLFEWALFLEDNVVNEFIGALLQFGSTKIRNNILKKMFSVKLTTECKLNIIEQMILSDVNKKISFVAENLLVRVNLVVGDFEGGKKSVIKRAYAFAAARTCIFESDLTKLRDVAYDIHEKLKDNGMLKKANDHKALACIIAVKSGLDAKDKSIYRLFFDTSEKKVEKMLALIEGET